MKGIKSRKNSHQSLKDRVNVAYKCNNERNSQRKSRMRGNLDPNQRIRLVEFTMPGP